MKGPKQGVLRAFIIETPLSYRSQFENSSCMLLISVGQPYHEGEKLSATIDLINAKFKSCIIMLCDTLQKYNMMTHFEAREAKEAALKNGNEWLERNAYIYKKLLIPYEVMRWDEIINDKNFERKLQKIETAYHINSNYKNAFTNTIESYVERVKKRSEAINKNAIFNNSLQYLKEECAGMLIWADKGFNFEVYPCKRTEVMEATFKLLIEPFFNDILIPVSLRFKKYAKNPEIMTSM